MKTVVAIFLACLLLTGCNTLGPYSARVYRIEESVFLVNLDTWLGSDNYSPAARERLKEKAQIIINNELRERGLIVDRCAVVRFIPYQGGHMGVTMIAGSAADVDRWAAMSEEMFSAELKERLPLSENLRFEGRLIIQSKPSEGRQVLTPSGRRHAERRFDPER